jgi:hypothetical protein
MTEEQFQKEVSEIKNQLTAINKNTNTSLWKAFFSWSD